MFSGIVEELAEVLALAKTGDPCRLTVKSSLDHSATSLGHSICISGVCLTVVDIAAGRITFDVSVETLRRSTLGDLQPGARVNLERALKYGDRIHGHLVFGHVDGTVELKERRSERGSERLWFSAAPELMHYIASKGSVALAGVSLTVGEVEPAGFSVYVIPHTLKLTSLTALQIGGRVNIEIDALARYVRTMLSQGQSKTASAATEIVTAEMLEKHGFLSGSRKR